MSPESVREQYHNTKGFTMKYFRRGKDPKRPIEY